MIKISLTLLFITISSAKLYKSDIGLDSDPEPTPNVKSNVWVLSLNDDSFNFNSLMLANKDEKNIFQNIILPTIKKIRENEKRSNKFSDNKRILNNSVVANQNSSRKEIESKLLSTINKLFMTHLNEFDGQLIEPSNHEEKSLQLYFSGPYSSLILKAGSNRYQYYINQPSPLPGWFYKAHTNIKTYNDTTSVEIPADIKTDFLKSFLCLLQMFLSFPM